MKKIIKKIKDSCFIRSFKEIDKRLFIIMGSNLLLIISIGIVFVLSSIYLKTGFDKIGVSDELIEGIKQNKEDPELAMNFLAERYQDPNTPVKFRSFLIKLSYNIIISIILISSLFALFKTFEWSKIEKKKLTKKFFTKYLGLLLIWNIAWIVLFVIIALGIKSEINKYFIWAEFVLFIYFSLLLYPLFSKEKEIFRSIKKVFVIGTIKFYKLVLPLVNLWIVLQIGYLLILATVKIPPIPLFIAIIYLLFYISWIKLYMLKVVENV